MAENFVILTDSGADISTEYAKEWNVRIIPLTYSVNDSDPIPGDQVNIKEFYEHQRNKDVTKTAAFGYGAPMKYFTEVLEEGKDVLYIGFSTGLSSSASTAQVVASELSEEYPDRKIYAIDTLAASLGCGLLVKYAVDMRDNGKTIDEIRDFIEENKLHLCHIFTVDDLFFLKRGGRVSAATAVVGSMLSIKPVLHVDNEGHLISFSKARGRKASIRAIADVCKEKVIDPEKQVMFISHGDCLEDAAYLASILKEELHPVDIMIDYVGPVIGSHSGPGTLALFFMGSER